jgi:hypothetical protein
MATAIFPDPIRPVLVPSRKAQAYPSLSQGREASREGDLTIHRITSTHHGRTLLTLGHAAEYLADSHRYSTENVDHASNIEAVHVLMEASRRVFEDFAEPRTWNNRFEWWLIGRAVRLFESVGWGARNGRRMSDNPLMGDGRSTC